MKKIITAINNPNLNENLRNEEFIKVIGKDIQYKEAILEVLENNKDIDIIIINEKIPGEINFIELIKKIKLINKKIKIIIILEKENNYLENELKNININSIYFNNKINLEKLIKIIKEKEINKEEELKEEIKRLEKIIEENKLEKNKIIKLEDVKEKIKNKKIIKNNKKKCRIINISGYSGNGKTMTAVLLSKYLEEKNKKILLIDMDFFHPTIKTVLDIKKEKINFKEIKKDFNYFNLIKEYNNLKNKKIIYLNKNNEKEINENINKKIEKNIINKIIKKNKKIKNNLLNKKLKYKINKKEKIIEINKIIKNKINKNLFVINNLKYFSENKKINIENFLEEILEINKNKYDYIIIDLGYNNREKINRKILKKSDYNLVIGEANILGVQELAQVLKKYTKEYDITKTSLHILLNKYTEYSIESEIIKNYFIQIKNIYKINYQKIYEELINTNFKSNKFIINKKLKNNFNIIIKNL